MHPHLICKDGKRTLAGATKECAFTFLDPGRNLSLGGHIFLVKWEAFSLPSQTQKKQENLFEV